MSRDVMQQALDALEDARDELWRSNFQHQIDIAGRADDVIHALRAALDAPEASGFTLPGDKTVWHFIANRQREAGLPETPALNAAMHRVAEDVMRAVKPAHREPLTDAAPDLLAALRRAYDWMEARAKEASKGAHSPYTLHDLRTECDALAAAIARAEGRDA